MRGRVVLAFFEPGEFGSDLLVDPLVNLLLPLASPWRGCRCDRRLAAGRAGPYPGDGLQQFQDQESASAALWDCFWASHP